MKAKLSYSSTSLDMVRRRFGVTVRFQSFLNPITPIEPSAWLQDSLRRAGPVALVSEKARSEFIVAPILLEMREVAAQPIVIYSGIRFDVAPEEGLQDICDFIVSRSELSPTLQAPLVMLVEAKKNDIESGLGQCAAEMIAAQCFNQQEGNPTNIIYGCITTGELWQFLQLDGTLLRIDPQRFYIERIGYILGSLVQMTAS